MEPYRNQFIVSEKMLKAANNPNSQHCPNICKYEKLAKIGQGTFGEVFKARHRSTQQFVALKKILMENEREGFPITALREIKILRELKHRNIVNLIEVCQSVETTANGRFRKPTFYLVFDFCEHDLAGILNTKLALKLAEIKMIMKQLLNGLFYLHTNKILHRDMKSANILITKEGVLKIADFGLSRPFRTNQPNRLTNRVVTLWYRPPEILLGDRNYNAAVDMWGAGCIMAELWTKVPILQGANEQHQITLISDLCGSITPQSLPGVENLELYAKIVLPTGKKRKLRERLKEDTDNSASTEAQFYKFDINSQSCSSQEANHPAEIQADSKDIGFVLLCSKKEPEKMHVQDEVSLQLLDALLTIDPLKRVDADNALLHDFFYTNPLPCDEISVLAGLAKSQFEYNKQNSQTVVAPAQPRRNDDQYYDPVY